MADRPMTRMGLVGAGPWASQFHAPMIANSPDAELAAVWARRPEAAAELAEKYGATVAATFDDLLESCEAVAFAVPPDIQAKLAPRAAAAGKHLLLEKPLAFTLDGAERVARAVADAGVVSMVMFRNRFDPAVISLFDRADGTRPRGAIASFITGAALPGSAFATPWRIERGALMDIGPHVLDLVEALLGPVTELKAVGDPLRWVAITTAHESGAVGQVSLSITTPGADEMLRLALVTESGTLSLDDEQPADRPDSVAAVQQPIMAEFTAGIASGRDNPLDAQRGLEIARLLAAAEESMDGR
jgi:predicted dehydrogenase